MPFRKCNPKQPKVKSDPSKGTRCGAYKDLFITCGPVPATFLTDPPFRKKWEERIWNTAKSRSWLLKDSPQFFQTELGKIRDDPGETRYPHMHIHLSFDKESTQWLGFSKDLVKIVTAMPKDDPPPIQQPNCWIGFCVASAGRNVADIMEEYVLNPTKDKEVGVGTVVSDILGPKPPPEYSLLACPARATFPEQLQWSTAWQANQRANYTYNYIKCRLDAVKRAEAHVKRLKQERIHCNHTPEQAAILQAQYAAHIDKAKASIATLREYHGKTVQGCITKPYGYKSSDQN